MKPSPFFKDEREERELAQRRDAFTFADPQTDSKLVILLAGREGSGKTHLACSMQEMGPVYLIDTEYRAQMVTRKFSGVKFATAKSFKEMAIAIKAIIKHQEPGTIILDSGSDLQGFAEIEYLERSEKEKVGLPWNWAEVWRLCNAVIDEVKFSQKFHLVVTARLKEEYANDKGTGRMIPRIYSGLPYKADVVLQFTDEKIPRINITKNGFTGLLPGPIGRDISLPQLVHTLSGATVAQTRPVVRKAS